MTIGEKTSANSIGKIDYEKMAGYISIAVSVLVNEHKRQREGGSFSLRYPSGLILFSRRFGKPDLNKASKYDRLAAEKTKRLARHSEHILSWESRNEELEQYQGAARSPNGLLGGFSGFPAEEDEVLVLWVFTKMGWLDGKEAHVAAQISANSRYVVLVQQFNRALKDH